MVVDLSAEAGGNCEYTQAGKVVATPNAVSVVGYTDLPSRMATQVRVHGPLGSEGALCGRAK